MVKVRVIFRQRNSPAAGRSLVKEIELAAIPVPGSLFEYDPGWGLCGLVDLQDSGMHLIFSKDRIDIAGYGPQFNAEETKSLLALGWEIV